MINFENVIIELQKEREVFHSEDDLKLSLGIKIKELYPKFEVRLERPICMIDNEGNKPDVRATFDIIIYDKDTKKSIPIELKYKTKKLDTEHNKHNGESYDLKTHGATNIGRYSFRKDIYRIEQYLSTHKDSDYGFVFILTNEGNYVDNNVDLKENLDKHFTCHQDSKIEKEYKGWNYSKFDTEKCEKSIKNKKHWTFNGDWAFKLELKSDYLINWKDYSKLGGCEFKSCLIKIENLNK